MRSPGNRKGRRAFTLLELLLVLVIVSILAAIAVFTYKRIVNKARFTQAQTALKHLQKTETIYFSEHDIYMDNTVVIDFDPTKYDYYQVTVALDNGGKVFTGTATGIGAMAGDLWHIHQDGEAVHDTPNF